jgi:Na+/proline symporter
MSTADSQLLVAASSLVRDFYQKVMRKERPVEQRLLVLYSRGVVLVLVVSAILLALTADELVFWLVLFAWAGLGAAIGPTSILALYWRRATRTGIFAGLVVGSVTTIVWGLTPVLKSRLYELVPAFALGLLATIVVSWFTRPPADVDELLNSMK